MISPSLRNTLAVAGTVFAFAMTAPVSATTITFTIDDANTCNGQWVAGGTATAPTLTCTPTTSSGTLQCSITPSKVWSAGGTATLQYACSVTNVTNPSISYSWKQGTTQLGTAYQQQITLTTTPTTYTATATYQSQTLTASTTQSYSNTAPPPTSTFCSGYQAVDMGNLQFDGHTVNTGPLGTQGIAYWRIQVPNPLPAAAQLYKTSIRTASISRDAYRKAYLSKDRPCDFTVTGAAFSDGVSTSNSVIFGSAGDRYRVGMNAGEVWYYTVVQDGLPSDGFYYAAYFPF